jgi:hypothetical protein
MQLASAIFADDEERETYFVTPEARQLLVGFLKPMLLTTCISRQGVVFLWPVPLPNDEGGGGRSRAWGETARQAADLARTKWVRMRADMALGAYRVVSAEAELPEPTWPEKTFPELLTIAFRGCLITGPDHPVVRRLRGLT